jgi:hypothetical protein
MLEVLAEGYFVKNQGFHLPLDSPKTPHNFFVCAYHKPMEKLKQGYIVGRLTMMMCRKKTHGEYKSMKLRVSMQFKERPLVALCRTMGDH